ncbi:hypothetical protein [Saccharothrix longispora]|uniref:hypothetical protein n=1 Tax=Saccharothrix longispora TaxID=33920 RepID=UPI0031E821FC
MPWPNRRSCCTSSAWLVPAFVPSVEALSWATCSPSTDGKVMSPGDQRAPRGPGPPDSDRAVHPAAVNRPSPLEA